MKRRKEKMPDYLGFCYTRPDFRNSVYSEKFFWSLETKTVMRTSGSVHLCISVVF